MYSKYERGQVRLDGEVEDAGLRDDGVEGAAEDAVAAESSEEGSGPGRSDWKVPSQDPDVLEVRAEDGHPDVCGQEAPVRRWVGGDEVGAPGQPVEGPVRGVEQENQDSPPQVVRGTAWCEARGGVSRRRG